jgi:RNA polymerase sigma factor (sigma-70 family)
MSNCNCICITNTCNDIQTRNKLVEDNLRFVFWCADGFSTYNVPREELISAGNEALIESANRFDPTYGTRFISYAVRNIRQSMFDTVNEYYQTVHIPSNRLKDVKIHYESFEVFNAPYADEDNDHLAPQNRLHAEPTTSQTELLYDEECEALRHFLSQYLGTSEVDFLMDYTLMKASGLKPKELVEKLAEEYRLPTRLVKSRLKSLRKKVNDLHLYAAYLNQAA